MTIHPPLEHRLSTRPLTSAGPPVHPTSTVRRIGIVVIVVGLLALSGLAAFNLTWTKNALHNELDARARESASASAAFVADRWHSLADALEYYAAQPSLAHAVAAGERGRTELTAILRQIQGADPTLAGVSVLDPTGRLVAATAWPRFIGYDFSTRDYFRGVSQSGQTYVSTAYVGVEHNQLANVITPIDDAKGVIGYLNAARSVPKTSEIVTSFAKSADLNVIVTDQSGATVVTSDKSPLGKINTAYSAWLTPALRGETGTKTINTPQGKSVVSYGHVDFGWIVAAQLPESIVTHPLGDLRTATILLAGTLGLVLVIGGLALHRANRARERAADQLRQFAEERAQLAREVNDTIVQGLVAAEMAYDLGRDATGRDLLRRTSRQARDWVGDLVQETGLRAGVARRRHPPPHDVEVDE